MFNSLKPSRQNSGFSFIELLTVLTIIGVIAAIAFPAFSSAKQKGGEVSCLQNLRSIYVAIQLYREQQGGSDAPGTAAEMGFPDIVEFMEIDKPYYKCRAAPYYIFSERYPYFYVAVDPPRGNYSNLTWFQYVSQLGDSASVIADLNHNDRSQPPASPYQINRALTITLSGSLRTIEKRADWEYLGSEFWR